MLCWPALIDVMNVIRCYLRDRRAWPLSLSPSASWVLQSNGPIMHQNGGWRDRPKDGGATSITVDIATYINIVESDANALHVSDS